MFASGEEHYNRNVRDAAGFIAAPARIRTPDGGQEPGLVIWGHRAIRAVLPATEALRLANQIADALAAHRAEA